MSMHGSAMMYVTPPTIPTASVGRRQFLDELPGALDERRLCDNLIEARGMRRAGKGVIQLLDVRLPAVGGGGVTRMVRGRSAPVTLFAYGFGYGLASTGCTLPLYVSITVLPLTSGFSGAVAAAFVAFALAIAVLMLTTTLLVAVAKQELVETLQRSAVRIKRASGLVLIVAGLYLIYFYLRTGM